MPKGPRGEKRHADTVQNAMHIGRIATGDATDEPSKAPNRAKGGRSGGRARAESMTKERRIEIASKAAKMRWNTNT
jgi:hypothetical protein